MGTSMRRVAVGGWLGMVLLTLVVAPAWAEDESAWGYGLWHELMSPYCPGRALADCPSPAAEDLRTWIVEQAEAGRSKEEVEAVLFGKFGDEIRQAPKAEGFGITAYALPILVFLAGGALVAIFLRRQASKREDDAATFDGYGERVDSALEERFQEEFGDAP